MTELIIKMLICLLGAFIIGFIFGYLISKVFGKKKHIKEVEELNSLLSSEEKKNALLKDELSIVKDTSATQTFKLTEKEKELETHIDTVKELNHLFQEKDKNNVLLQEKLVQTEETSSAQALMLSEAEGEIKRHTIVVKDLNTIVKQLEEENVLLTNELTQVKKELHTNSFKLNESEKEINSFKEQNTIQEKTIQDKKNDNEKLHVSLMQEKESSVEKIETPKAETKEENKVEDTAITGGLLSEIKGLFDKVTKTEVETPNLNTPEIKVPEIYRDNLQDIKGIGETLESKLNDIGIYNFEQISKWSSEDIQAIKEKIPFNIEIKDEEWEGWIEQAKLLIKSKDK